MTEKRVFLVCRSKNCQEAKRAGTRCTISAMVTSTFKSLDVDLNRRKFCVLYSSPIIVKISNTPNWKISTEKPGLRKIKEREKEAETEFLVNNPNFLEVN